MLQSASLRWSAPIRVREEEGGVSLDCSYPADAVVEGKVVGLGKSESFGLLGEVARCGVCVPFGRMSKDEEA